MMKYLRNRIGQNQPIGITIAVSGGASHSAVLNDLVRSTRKEAESENNRLASIETPHHGGGEGVLSSRGHSVGTAPN